MKKEKITARRNEIKQLMYNLWNTNVIVSCGRGRTKCVCVGGGCVCGDWGDILSLVHSAHFRYSLIELMSDTFEFCYKMMNSSTLTLKVTDILWLKYCFGTTKIDPRYLK